MSTSLRFDCFEVDLAAGQLFKHGIRIHLREQPFQVLAMLVESPGEVVTREELRRRLWPDDVFVDFDNNLNTAIARLREVLSDSPEHPRFIETLPKRGYRFTAPIVRLDPDPGRLRAQKVRVVVLPFVNLSGDPGLEPFSDAVTDDIITEFAAVAGEQLAVIARTSAMRYKGRERDAARVGRELRVDYIVEGGVRRAEDRIGINVQVVRVRDQEHVFAKRYDGSAAEIFGLQGRIAREIAVQTGATAGVEGIRAGAAAGARVTGKPTGDVAGFNEYVQGLHYIDRMSAFSTGDHGHRARAHLEAAIARDPGFALAHEALAQMYWILGYVGFLPPREAFAAGMLHAARVLAIDNTRAEAHALVAQFRKQLDYDWPAIEQEITRALELNPASPLVRMLHAVGWLMPQGRLGEAIMELERALERDPLSYQLHFWQAIMHSLAREPDRVVERTRLMIDLEPASPPGPWLLGVALSRMGKFEEAIAALQTAVDLSGGAAIYLGWLGLVLGAGGRTQEARSVLDRLEVMGRTTYVPPASIAWVLLGLRDTDRAFEWLDRAVDAHDQIMMPIKTYTFFDPIRNDPRFHELLRKMKLTAA